MEPMTDMQTATTVTEEKLLEVEEQLSAALGAQISSLTESQKEILRTQLRSRTFTQGGSANPEGGSELSPEEAVALLVPLVLKEIEGSDEIDLLDITPEDFADLIQELLTEE
jgi:hypothetical protein